MSDTNDTSNPTAAKKSGRRLAVVTGGHADIGYAIVKNLVQRFSGDVLLTASDEVDGENAVIMINNELDLCGQEPVTGLSSRPLDINDAVSVQKLANYIRDQYGRALDILVHNASIVYKKGSHVPFKDLAEKTVMANYYGTQLIVDALLPLMRPGGRVVIGNQVILFVSKVMINLIII